MENMLASIPKKSIRTPRTVRIQTEEFSLITVQSYNLAIQQITS